MSYGVESAQSFIQVATTTANNGVSAPRTDGLGHSLSVQNFEDSLRAAQGVGAPELRLAQADATTTIPGTTATDVTPPILSSTGTPPVAEASPSAETDARLRAAEGLGLTEETVGPGNSILNGLEQLRATFDSQYGSVGAKLEGTKLDTEALMTLQADLVQYSVLVDVSSKLAGKVTTSIDSLMKGQ